MKRKICHDYGSGLMKCVPLFIPDACMRKCQFEFLCCWVMHNVAIQVVVDGMPAAQSDT